jgi:hypothetical protein
LDEDFLELSQISKVNIFGQELTGSIRSQVHPVTFA